MLPPRFARVILGGLAVALLVGVGVGVVFGTWEVLGVVGTISFFAIVILLWLDTPPGGFENFN